MTCLGWVVQLLLDMMGKVCVAACFSCCWVRLAVMTFGGWCSVELLLSVHSRHSACVWHVTCVGCCRLFLGDWHEGPNETNQTCQQFIQYSNSQPDGVVVISPNLLLLLIVSHLSPLLLLRPHKIPRLALPSFNFTSISSSILQRSHVCVPGVAPHSPPSPCCNVF